VALIQQDAESII